jgi:heme exporter protein A
VAVAAIELIDVARSYGERAVLRGVSVSAVAGSTLLVLGANGAGKTTLLRIVAGLLRPHRGAVHVDGSVGFLGHESLLYRDLSAAENLRYHARLHRVPERRVETVLEAVGLGRRADDPVRTLSRGMVQRAAIARAVLHEPDVLLLDEPYANLDPGAAQQVRPLLAGGTRLLVSHDVEAGLAEADAVLGLRDGRVSTDIERLYAGSAGEAGRR